MKKKKQLTSDDIESATVYLHSKDGRIFVTNINDKFTILGIVANNTFAELDAEKVATIKISELIKSDKQ